MIKRCIGTWAVSLPKGRSEKNWVFFQHQFGSWESGAVQCILNTPRPQSKTNRGWTSRSRVFASIFFFTLFAIRRFSNGSIFLLEGDWIFCNWSVDCGISIVSHAIGHSLLSLCWTKRRHWDLFHANFVLGFYLHASLQMLQNSFCS